MDVIWIQAVFYLYMEYYFTIQQSVPLSHERHFFSLTVKLFWSAELETFAADDNGWGVGKLFFTPITHLTSLTPES